MNTILMIAVISALSVSFGDWSWPVLTTQQQLASEKAPTDQVSGIRLTIATVGPMFGPPTDRYKVGEQVPISIRMTNTSSQPGYACLSSDLYQDLPQLTKNGRLLPYSKWQSDVLSTVQREQTCQHYEVSETMVLKTNEATVVDFLVLADDSRLPTGALSWYDPLTPGVYELTVQRRPGCCDGPMIDSNKIRFEVVP